ncbi:spinster family MFS transporter [Caballeronia sp. S22]|uniref:spinster family MFS transporter n=1 Tax=Caballeronia sp. S22 TaxID=3137182 RepID=UPI0035314F81
MENTEALSTTSSEPETLPKQVNGFPKAGYAWCVVGVLLFAYSVSFVDRLILSLMVTPIRSDLHISDTGISLLQGLAFALLYTFFGLILGRWADQHNRIRLIVAGITVWCLATVACGFAHTFAQLFVARIFVGVGEAALSPAAYSLIADSFSREKRGRAVSVYGMGIFIGSGTALIFGGLVVKALSTAKMVDFPLLGELAPWRVAFIVVGASGLLAAALALTIREPSRKELTSRSPNMRDFLGFVAARRAALGTAIIINSCMAMVNFSIAAWLPVYFIRVFKWSPLQIGTAYGTILLTAGCVGMATGGVLADRLVKKGNAGGAMVVIRWATAFIPPCVLWVGWVESPAVALCSLAAASFFLGVPTGLGPSSIHAIAPNQFRGQTVALLLFSASVFGLGMGPTFVAIITDYVFHYDLSVGHSLSIVVFAASLLSVVVAFYGRKAYELALSSNTSF